MVLLSKKLRSKPYLTVALSIALLPFATSCGSDKPKEGQEQALVDSKQQVEYQNKNFEAVGAVKVLQSPKTAISSEQMERLLKIVEDEKTKTEYKRPALLDYLKALTRDKVIVGFHALKEDKNVDEDFGAFAVIGRDSKGSVIDVMFSSQAYRGKGLFSAVPAWLQQNEKPGTPAGFTARFAAHSEFGSEWINTFLVNHLKKRASGFLTDEFDAKSKAEVTMLAGMNFEYVDKDAPKPALNLSALQANPEKPVLFFTTGLPGAGKNYAVEQAQKAGLLGNDVVGIDLDDFTQPYLDQGMKAEEAYDKGWQDLVRARKQIFDAGRSAVVFTTSQNPKTFTGYHEAAAAAGKSYRSVLLYVKADGDLAQKRAMQRAGEGGQGKRASIPAAYMDLCRKNIPQFEIAMERTIGLPTISLDTNIDGVVRISSVSYYKGNADSEEKKLWKQVVGEETHWTLDSHRSPKVLSQLTGEEKQLISLLITGFKS